MLLVMDIGNSSVSYGFYERGRLRKVGYTSTGRAPKIIKKFFGNKKRGPKWAVALSVVPQITRALKRAAKRSGPLARLWMAGEDIKIPIKHRYRNIKKLGRDRLVNIYGALKLYPPPLLILDYGTALTCDYISKKGVFLGGLIIPGPAISLKALSEKAALLPSLKFPWKHKGFIGQETREGMEAGILEGYAAMTDGLVERFRRRYGPLRAVATGGLSKAIYPSARKVDTLDPHLTLKALVRVFQELIKLIKIPS